MITLGDRLQQARTRRRLTLQETQKLTGIERTHISRLENNRANNAYLRTIETLADTYHVSIDWLLGRHKYCHHPSVEEEQKT